MKENKSRFSNIKGMLSRDEMKQVRGGSGGLNGPCANPGSICIMTGSGGQPVSGNCVNVINWGCVCNIDGSTGHCAVL